MIGRGGGGGGALESMKTLAHDSQEKMTCGLLASYIAS